MATITKAMKNTEQFTLTADPKDSDGNPVEASVSFTLGPGAAGICTLDPQPDGRTCVVRGKGLGAGLGTGQIFATAAGGAQDRCDLTVTSGAPVASVGLTAGPTSLLP